MKLEGFIFSLCGLLNPIALLSATGLNEVIAKPLEADSFLLTGEWLDFQAKGLYQFYFCLMFQWGSVLEEPVLSFKS